MSKRAAPLLVDRLPLYATGPELVLAIVGADAENAKFARAMFDWRGFPRKNHFLGGRYYVPAVVEFFDAHEKSRNAAPSPDGDIEKEAAAWNTRKTKARRA